jgi:hypothetical protein
MLSSATDPEGFFCAWGETSFYRFMARLYALWRSIKINSRLATFRDLGIYQKLLQSWNDDKAYAKAIVSACEYHCKRTTTEDEDGAEIETEFWRWPFPTFPAEILAVQRVRRELRGSSADVSHPLLDTPLGRPPERIPVIDDRLLTRVIERVRADLVSKTSAALRSHTLPARLTDSYN